MILKSPAASTSHAERPRNGARFVNQARDIFAVDFLH